MHPEAKPHDMAVSGAPTNWLAVSLLFRGLSLSSLSLSFLTPSSSWIALSGIGQARLMAFTCMGMAHAVAGRQRSSVRSWVAALDMASLRQVGSCLLSSCCLLSCALALRAGRQMECVLCCSVLCCAVLFSVLFCAVAMLLQRLVWLTRWTNLNDELTIREKSWGEN